jgi:hypothetical protein
MKAHRSLNTTRIWGEAVGPWDNQIDRRWLLNTANSMTVIDCVFSTFAADRKLTHLRPYCRFKTDPGVLLAPPKFWAEEKQGDHLGNVEKNSTDVFARQGVAA